MIKRLDSADRLASASRFLSNMHVIAIISYDPEKPEGEEFDVIISELGVGMLNTLTDFELKVLATEAGIRVRQAFEMPPSLEKKK